MFGSHTSHATARPTSVSARPTTEVGSPECRSLEWSGTLGRWYVGYAGSPGATDCLARVCRRLWLTCPRRGLKSRGRLAFRLVEHAYTIGPEASRRLDCARTYVDCACAGPALTFEQSERLGAALEDVFERMSNEELSLNIAQSRPA